MGYWAHDFLEQFPSLEFFHYHLHDGRPAIKYLLDRYPHYFQGKLLEVGAGLGSLSKFVPNYTGIEKYPIDERQQENNVIIKPFGFEDTHEFDTILFLESIHLWFIAFEAKKLIDSGKTVIIFDNMKWLPDAAESLIKSSNQIVFEDMSELVLGDLDCLQQMLIGDEVQMPKKSGDGFFFTVLNTSSGPKLL